ncbi:MAG: hypothetical protein ACR2MM_07720 [Flavobacteriaceae bacterium]
MKNPGIESIHFAAQYLAAAGISFLPQKEDDSHTNLGFSTEEKQMLTRVLNEDGDFLAFDLNEFALVWNSAADPSKLVLEHLSHGEVLDWIHSITKNSRFSNPYSYQFPYSLPYEISNDYKYALDPEKLELERKLRTLATQVLGEVLNQNNMHSEIRIWPHHLDTGAFAKLPEKESVSIGMGLAIPDALVNDYYFYISGYEGHAAISPTEFDSLSQGKWHSDGFTGGILPSKGRNQGNVQRFFNEAIRAFKG